MSLITLNELEEMTPLFRGRIGNAFCKGLLSLLSIDKVNDLYLKNSSLKGPAFAQAVISDIGLEYEILNKEFLNDLPDGPFITISNHPYGHIDGIILVDIFGRIRPDFKVMVNSFLTRIESMRDNFISVIPTGNQYVAPAKDNIQGVKAAISHVCEGRPLGLFPSGAVSDLSLRDRCIRDREWQDAVIRLIRKLEVPVVPVHFIDRNSDFYYSLGLIDWRVRLLKLPSEVFNKRGKITRVAIGEIIDPEQLRDYHDIESLKCYLRNKVYNQF